MGRLRRDGAGRDSCRFRLAFNVQLHLSAQIASVVKLPTRRGAAEAGLRVKSRTHASRLTLRLVERLALVGRPIL